MRTVEYIYTGHRRSDFCYLSIEKYIMGTRWTRLTEYLQCIFDMEKKRKLSQNYYQRPPEWTKKVKEKSRECHNHKPQLFPEEEKTDKTKQEQIEQTYEKH